MRHEYVIESLESPWLGTIRFRLLCDGEEVAREDVDIFDIRPGAPDHPRKVVYKLACKADVEPRIIAELFLRNASVRKRLFPETALRVGDRYIPEDVPPPQPPQPPKPHWIVRIVRRVFPCVSKVPRATMERES